jgi:hypothetical protein
MNHSANAWRIMDTSYTSSVGKGEERVMGSPSCVAEVSVRAADGHVEI